MVRTAALISLIAGVLCITAAGQAAKDPFGGARDLATGAGSYGAPGCTVNVPAGVDPFCLTTSRREFNFNATADPLGNDARGTFRTDAFRIPTGELTSSWVGVVTCLNVVGNAASFGGYLTQDASPTLPAGTPFIEYVVDNSRVDPALPDLISPFAVLPVGDPDRSTVPDDFPATCPPPIAPRGYFPLQSGDISVVDATCGEVRTNPNGKLKCKGLSTGV